MSEMTRGPIRLLAPTPIGVLARVEARRDGVVVGSWDADENGSVRAYLPDSLAELVGIEMYGIRPNGDEVWLAAWRETEQ